MAPHRGKNPQEGEKQYFCDCERYCKGRVVDVSRSTYQRHAPYRKPGFSQAFIRTFSNAHNDPHTSVAPQSSEISGNTQVGTGIAGTSGSVTDPIFRSGNSTENDTPQQCNTPPGAHENNHGSVNTTENHTSQQRDADAAPGFDMDEPGVVGTCDEDEAGDMGLGADQMPAAVRADRGSLDDDETTDNRADVYISQPQPNVDLQELSDIALLEDMKCAMDFIRALQDASLDKSNLDKDIIERLRNPPTSPVDVGDPDLRLGLGLFLATINASQETYNLSRNAIIQRHPDDRVPSFDQIKRHIADITGVVPILEHMCPNSCLAFTGPFATLNMCPECGEPRYSDVARHMPRQEFYTMPLGPLLQALWRDRQSAERMCYRRRKTQEIIEELQSNDGHLKEIKDFLYSLEYLDCVRSGRIRPEDTVLMLSLDGAQLYAHKASDCWIYIWIIFDIDPEFRYKNKIVLVGGIIPGPNKPKNAESYLFPGLYHVAALQREGLRIWDASQDKIFVSYPFVALGAADGPGITYLNGLVGHNGKHGCRLYCSVTGRHKKGSPKYFPALLKPLNHTVLGCSHDDIPLTNLPSCSSQLYHENLRFLLASDSQAEYKKRRLQTGISRPSIFLGLNQEKILGVPGCFGADIMHLASLNIPDLLINLWRGTFDCDKDDSRASWDWAVLQGSTWVAHGRQIASATPYLPGSFDRPPRNPAEKISSGYKAWEFLLYLYGLGPGVFYNVLPEKYWRHFCKLVFGMRIVHQYSIKTQDLNNAHQAFLEFVGEFEILYYQRRPERLHFVRQSIHALTHLAPEAFRIGPPACSSQWTMERTIGNLGREIRQPSNPFTNLSERGLLRCQINAIKAMIPDLEPPIATVPRGGKDLGGGYMLLRARDRTHRPLQNYETAALVTYLGSACDLPLDNWSPSIVRWARLRLPNGQVARSSWKERLKPLTKVRMARNVKFSFEHGIRFAEVYYYFRLCVGEIEKTLAMVSVYSTPHQGLLQLSYNTLWSCTHHGDSSLSVIDVKSILAVVAMVPHQPFPQHPIGRYFVVEKPGLDVATLAGHIEDAPDEE